MNTATPNQDSGLRCLLILSRFHGVPADGAQLRHVFGESDGQLSDIGLLRAAKHLGLKADKIRSSWQDLTAAPLPAMAKCVDGHYKVVAKLVAGKILVHDPLQDRPVLLDQKAFEELWTGELILLAKRAGPSPSQCRFDLTWFIPAIVKYRRLLGEVLVASFLLQVFALLTPLFTQVVIDKVLVHKGFTTLHVLAIGMLTLALFEAVLGGLRTYLFAHTTNRIDVGLGAQLFRHVLALPLAYFEARRVGDTVSRVRELEYIRQFLTSSTLTVLVDISFTLIFLLVMWLYSPTMTLIVAGSLPFYVLLSTVITPAIRGRLNEKFDRGAENQSFLVETVSGIQTVKALAVEPILQRRWDEQLAAYVSASFRAASLMTVASQIGSCIQRLTTILILWMGAYLVIGGEISIGQLIAFNMLAGQVTGPLLRLVTFWQDFQQVGISIQRLGDVLNTPAEPSYQAASGTPARITGRIRFEDVTFRYRPDGQAVLRNVTLTIAPGQVIGVVGRSGSGKSTLTRLIQRLYMPDSGKVMVDGMDVTHVDPAWLRRHVGVVLQESFLFNRSVRDNIALSDPGLPMERIIHAATLAGAHEFIMELPDGYDTQVGDSGCLLSGGQRQRIAIARALVANPRILIFDEATSALDYESESVIQHNLRQIAKGRTVMIIAHRLSTVRRTDRIYVMDKGAICEEGTHDELLKRNGTYALLHHHQEGRSVAA